MLWIVAIMMLPIPATAVYLLLGADMLASRTTWSLVTSTNDAKKYYQQDPEVLEELNRKDPQKKGQFHYISHSAGFPFYRNTGFDYYGLGDIGYPVMLEEMKKAEKFIFLEYFIIEEGEMWNGMLEILEQKAKEGLDVRVMYDDVGSIATYSISDIQDLKHKGIKCIPFNPLFFISDIIVP
jgi:cardiolipin synthase